MKIYVLLTILTISETVKYVKMNVANKNILETEQQIDYNTVKID